LEGLPSFDFNRDVLPEELRDLLDKPRRVITVDRPDVELVKGVIEKTL
jgi:threonine synthase